MVLCCTFIAASVHFIQLNVPHEYIMTLGRYLFSFRMRAQCQRCLNSSNILLLAVLYPAVFLSPTACRLGFTLHESTWAHWRRGLQSKYQCNVASFILQGFQKALRSFPC